MAQAVAQPQPQMMTVQVPSGMAGGMAMQVNTPAGLMQVTIPNGLVEGQTFQMQMPAQQPMIAQGQPVMQQQQQQPMMQQQRMQQQQQPQQPNVVAGCSPR